MSADRTTTAPTGRAGWLAVAFSVGLHGLLLLLLLFGPSGGDGPGGGVAVDTLVVDDGPDVRLSLDEGPPPAKAVRPAAPQRSQDDEPPGQFEAHVLDSAPVLPVPAPAPAAAVAIPEKPGAGRGTGPARPDSGKGSGPIRTAAFFQVSAPGRSVVYVIDRSISMGINGALAAAKHELSASLLRLPADARFQVILYNRSAEPLHLDGRNDLLPVTDELRRQAIRLVEAVRAEGGTGHLAALKRALALRPDVIFFVTDADDLAPEHVRAVTLLNQGHTAIHAIQVGASRGSANGPLALLARSNRGSYRAVNAGPGR
jgi:hypothetical protein